MFIESGLIAMAMLGGEPQPARPAPSFQLKVITVEGLGWRSAAYSRLVPVARQGTSTVWTADKALAKSLEAASQGETARATASLDGDSSGGQSGQIYFIAHANRFADGPINQATAVAYTPEVATFDEGIKAHVNGRKLDQGVLTTLTLEDHHLEAIHTVSLAESLKPAAGEVVKTSAPGTTGIATTVQVPEVSHASVRGEWMIPNEGVILISLGVHTLADPSGKAVVRERLAILEVSSPSPMPAQTIAPGQQTMRPSLTEDQQANLYPPALGTYVHARDPIPEGISRSIPPVPVASLVMPPMPARSLPEAVDAQGKVVELPPLPEAYASTDLDRIKPSPQAAVSGPVDADLAQTSFVPVPADVPVPRLANGDPVTFLPLNCLVRKLQKAGGYEGYAVVVSSQEPGEPQGPWIRVVEAPKCDDEDCQAEAAEAAKLMKRSTPFAPAPVLERARPATSQPKPMGVAPKPSAHPVTDGKSATVVESCPGDLSFFPTIDEAQRLSVAPSFGTATSPVEFVLQKLMSVAAVSGCDVEVVAAAPGDAFTVKIKKAAGPDDAACHAETTKLAGSSVAPHCENGADCEGMTASKLQKMGGPTGAEAVFVKFLESLNAIEPELTPLGELVAEKALVKLCGALNKMGFSIEIVEDGEKPIPKPPTEDSVVVEGATTVASAKPEGALSGLVKAFIGSGIKIEIKIEPTEAPNLGKMAKELPSAKYFHDDVQYLAIPGEPKVDHSAKKAADEAPKSIKCPAEPGGMTGPEAYRRGMAKLVEATLAAGRAVEMKFDPADNPAFCKHVEAMNPGMKPGASIDFDIVEGAKRVDDTAASLGFNVNVKNPDGMCVLDAEMNLTPAIKTPGKTEMVVLPLGGGLALEIKATVVPAPTKAKPATKP